MNCFLQKVSFLFVIIFSVGIGNFAIAQDADRINPKANLEALSQKFEAEYLANRTRALELAKKNGWAVIQVDSIGNISELMGVDASGIPIYYSTANVAAARTIRTNQGYPFSGYGLNLTGKFYTLGIWDGGAVRVSHKDFGGRVTYKDTVRTIESHPTHVAGTMIASGRNPNARGMAYEANLWAYSWDNDLAEMATAAKNDLLISNHSYGKLYGWKKNDATNEYEWFGDTTISGTIDYHYGFYSNTSKNLDELAFNAKDYLMVFAAHNTRIYDPPTLNIRHKVFYNGTSFYSTKKRASNNNFDCLNDNGVAKNVLTVGAVNPLNKYTIPSDVVMSDFSAWGPTDDGRIKPDIVGDGVGVYSTEFESDSAYGYKSGTSMASPSVSGSLLLIQQQYNINTGKFLSAAALKAVAIHTADEAGTDTGPDYQFGWGLMNTKKAVDLINNTEGLHTIKNGILFKNTQLDYALPTDGNSGYRVTIVWTDPAGTVSAPSLNSRTPKLVNDLDIKILDLSDGETHYPWRLDPNNPATAATKGDNFRDNVEVIDVPYLPSSNYVVRVSHKGQLANNQPFTVIISKIPINVPTPSIDVNALEICPGKSVQFINTTLNVDFFTKYTWSFPGGVPSSYVGKTPPPITYNQPGKYNVVLIGNNGPFTKSTIISEYITVADLKPGSATIQQRCEFGNILIDTVGKFYVSKVDWYVNNFKVKTNTGLNSFYYDNLNNGDIVKAIIQAISDCGTPYTIEAPSITLIKSFTPKPNITLTSNSLQYCSNSSVRFTANSAETADEQYYKWMVNGNNYQGSSKNFIDLNYYEDIDYEIYCIATFQNQCSNPTYDTSNVLNIKFVEQTEGAVTISAPRTNICNSDFIQTEAFTNIPEEGRQIDWYKNDVFIANMAMVFGTTYEDGDKIYCKITSTNPCLTQSVVTSNTITFRGSDRITPTVSLEASATNICEGANVTFVATPFAGAVDPVYIWYYNEVEVQNGFNATWSYNNFAEGDMVYCMIYPQQCSVREYAYSNPIYITIRERFSELSISTPDTAICTGTAVTFTANLSNPGINPNYKWKINGVSQGNRGGLTFVTSTLNNGDIVECEVQQSGTCAIQLGPYSNKIKMTVYPNAAPTLNIETISGVCSNDNIVFRANATHTNPSTTYQWVVNGSTKQNSTSNTFSSATLQENDFVYCNMFTNSACATSNTATSNIIQIKFQSTFEPTIRIEQRALNLCENQPIEFYLYSSDIDPTTTFSWKINGEIVQVNNNKANFITSDLKNNDVVTCLLTSQNQCLANQEILSNEIKIEIVNASPKIRIESTLICKGTPPTFYAISSDVPKGSLYYWKKNGSYEQTGEDSTYIPPFYQEGDIISCTLFPKACPGDEINSNEITIPAIPNIQPNIIVSVEGSLCSGKFATFKATATDAGSNPIYKWKLNRNFVLIGPSDVFITSNFKDGDLLSCTLVSSEPCALGREVTSVSIVIRPETPVDANLNVIPTFNQICEGQLQAFNTTVAVPSNQLKYSWFADGILVNDANGSTWSSFGIGAGNDVTCTVESDQVCLNPATSSATVDANVIASVTPTISIQTSNQIICKGTVAAFQATTTNAGSQPVLEWFVNNVSVQKGLSNQYFTSNLEDNDVVTCLVFPNGICTDEASYVSNSITITVYESQNPTIVIKSISKVNCEDGLAEFQAEATNVSSVSVYEWRINNIVVQSGGNFNFSTTALKDGDIVNCHLLRLDGCTGQQFFESNDITIQLTPKSTPTVEIIPNKPVLCQGETLQLTVSSTFGGQNPYYKWYLNDSLIIYDDTTLISLNSLADGDKIYCTLESSETCITTSLVNSNVFTVDFQGAVEPTISISAPTEVICSGTEVVFTANFTNGGNEPTFDWKINGVSVQNSASNNFQSVVLKNGDKVSCTMTSNNDCASTNTVNSNVIEISVIESVLPIVEIISDVTEICAGQNVSFKANYSYGGNAPTFDWKINGVSVQNSASNNFQSAVLKNGDKVSCTMISNNDCASANTINSNVIEISVIESVLPIVEIISDVNEICAGQNVSFKANYSYGGNTPTFDWKINGVSVQNSASNNFQSEVLKNGDKVSCIMISNNDCASANTVNSNVIEISVIESVLPIVEIISDVNEICAGQNVSFKANYSYGGTAPIFDWKVNGNIVQSSASNNFTSDDLVDGDKVSCTMISNSDCASTNIANSNEIEINVIESVVPIVEIVSDVTEICAGQNVSFKANYSFGGNAPIFEWKVSGNIVQSSASNNFVSDDLNDGDKVYCTMISNSDCASTNTANSNLIEINVKAAILPTVELIYNADTVCYSENVKLSLETQNLGTGTVYSWFKNGDLVGKNATLNISNLLPADEIWCVVSTMSVSCAVEVTAISDTFYAKIFPATTFEVYQKGDTLFATEGFESYAWYLDGRLVSLSANNFIVPEEPGLYIAQITDPNGCSEVFASINYVPTSIKNNKDEIFKIYPNPSTGKVYIQFNQQISGVVSVFQIDGRQVLKSTVVKNINQYSIDISEFPSGLYLITFEDAENMWSEKIIKMD